MNERVCEHKRVTSKTLTLQSEDANERMIIIIFAYARDMVRQDEEEEAFAGSPARRFPSGKKRGLSASRGDHPELDWEQIRSICSFAICRTKFRHFARSYTTDAAKREERDGRSTHSCDCMENERQATTE